MKHILPRLAMLVGVSLAAIPALPITASEPTAATHQFNRDQERPNVILIMTDDQGYGDLGSTGNSMLKTPQLDELSKASMRLTNFHVDPTCAETRSALMTGRYSTRTGVWHTIMGRSILRRDETTMAEVFRANGYATGMFGKWHLGDNFPYRPQDRGFDEVLCHGGGGVGQTPDYWGNDYFDDTYFHNGTPEAQDGYCTDVFFSAATRFIEAHQDEPFFCYLATNAAHGPFHVADRYAQPYLDQGVPQTMARFYGMIANIDENIGRLRERLKTLRLDQKTLLIFMTDNGTAAGWESNRNEDAVWKGFNAGMRGKKGSQYEGGHRVPCFVYGPGLGIQTGQSDQLSAHFDLLPTFVQLCDLDVPLDLQLDGQSLAPVLNQVDNVSLSERTLFVHSQRVDQPVQGRKCAVMTSRWRLVDLHELYDLVADPGQTKNVADKHPDVVRDLQEDYEVWWNSISKRFDDYVRIDLGAAECPTTLLTAHDWHPTEGGVPWNQGAISRDVVANGFWAVQVQQAGTYRITLTSRPPYVEHPLSENAGTAKVKIGDQTKVAEFAAGALSIEFEMELQPGPFRLQTWLEEAEQASRGAYFVSVEYLSDELSQLERPAFQFQEADRIVLLGNTFIERMQVHNYFECVLLSSLPELKLTFRNLGWSGDDVYGTARAVFGNRDAGYRRLIDDVRKAEPTVIIVAYGGNESYGGTEGLDEFKRAYTRLLDDLTTITPRLILLTPHRFENLGSPLPDHAELNKVRQAYGSAISDIAQEREHFVVDLFDPFRNSAESDAIRNRYTDQGIHFNEYGYWRLAPILSEALGVQLAAPLRLTIDAGSLEGNCTGGAINQVQLVNDQLSIELSPEKVPLPGPPKQLPRGGRLFAPHAVFQITGLEPGKYGLSIDGQPTVLASHEQWSDGVRLSLGEYAQSTKELRQRIGQRNELFFHFYRPQNETYLFLFRKHEQGNNAIEVEQFKPLIRESDKEIDTLSHPSPLQLKLIPIDE